MFRLLFDTIYTDIVSAYVSFLLKSRSTLKKSSSHLPSPHLECFGIACYTGSSSIVPELYYLPMISTIGKKELWLICYSLHFQTKALHVRLSPDRASFYLLVQNHEKLTSIHPQRIYDEQHGQMKTTHPLVFYISILF